MPSAEDKIPLVAIVGATAVGKTATALRVAEELGGEIVSADSRLFYRGMDIGTAKPSIEELARVPHHLIDVAAPDESWSLAVFQEAAQKVINEIAGRGKLPLLVGGTGQYVRAVIEGWQPPVQLPDPRLRTVLEVWGLEIGPLELHRRLTVLDPAAAAVNEASNMRRTVRSLEVILSTGRRLLDMRGKKETPYRLLVIGLRRPRQELYARVDARIEQMLASGFLDEVNGLLEKGYSPNLLTLSAIGYREMIAHLHGKMTLEEAVVLMKRLTRRYIRQQSNWFRDEDKQIHWFDCGDDTPAQVIDLIRASGY